MATPSSAFRGQFSGICFYPSSSLSSSSSSASSRHSSTKMTISKANSHNLKYMSSEDIVTFFSNINLSGDDYLTCLNTIDFSSWKSPQEILEFLCGIEKSYLPTTLLCLNTINFYFWSSNQIIKLLEEIEKRFLPVPLDSLKSINFSGWLAEWIVEIFKTIEERFLPIPLDSLKSIDFEDWKSQQIIKFFADIKRHFLPSSLDCLRTIDFDDWKTDQISSFFEKYHEFLPDFLENVKTISEFTKDMIPFFKNGKMSYTKYIDCSNWVPHFFIHLIREIPDVVLSLDPNTVNLDQWSYEERREFLLHFILKLSYVNKIKYFDIIGPHLTNMQINHLCFKKLNGVAIEKILRYLTEGQIEFLDINTVLTNLYKLPYFTIRLTQAIRDRIPTSLYTKKQLMELGAVLFPLDRIKQINPEFFDREFCSRFFDGCTIAESQLSHRQITKLNANKAEEVSVEEIDLLLDEIDKIMGDSSSTSASSLSSSHSRTSLSSINSTSSTSSLSSNSSTSSTTSCDFGVSSSKSKLAKYLKTIPESDINNLRLEDLASIDFTLLDIDTINRFLFHLSSPLLLCLNIPNLLKNAKKIKAPLILKIMNYFQSVKVNLKLDVDNCTSFQLNHLKAEHFIPESLKKLLLRDLGSLDNIMRFFNNNPDCYLSPKEALKLPRRESDE